MENLVAIAKTTKPRGLRGELAADILTGFPERFENLDRVFVVREGKETVSLSLENFFFQKDRVVLKFREIDSIEVAEKFRGAEICVTENETVELPEGEFFEWELEGCEIRTLDDEKIGIVKEIFRAGENVNLVVAGSEKEHMIPFVAAICKDVDIEKKLIRVDLPEGLLEF